MTSKIKLKLKCQNIGETSLPTEKRGLLGVTGGAPGAPRPILKWVGGKTQILETLMDHFPHEMDNYHEIFLGGGSVLLAVLSHIQTGSIVVHHKIYASDINRPLIAVYQNIQSHHQELYTALQHHIEEMRNCPLTGLINRKPNTLDEAQVSQESYYYWLRKQYNQLSDVGKTTIEGSSLFIMLNKTCFRGLFRMGPNGFNVPYGHYKHPTIVTQEHLSSVHHLIQNVVFTCLDFNEAINRVQAGDFVYLDPPYVPCNQKSFVGYTEGGFTLEQHQQLFNRLTDHTNFRFLLSNADVKLVRDCFADPKFKVEIIVCQRTINSKNPAETTNEVLIGGAQLPQ